MSLNYPVVRSSKCGLADLSEGAWKLGGTLGAAVIVFGRVCALLRVVCAMAGCCFPLDGVLLLRYKE